jgi:hypothetical protein
VEKIGWTNFVRNEKALHGVKEERNMLHTVEKKDNWVDHTA